MVSSNSTTPLCPRRQCLRCAPASVPVFRFGKNRLKHPLCKARDAPVRPTNESSRWRSGGCLQIKLQTISEIPSRPAWGWQPQRASQRAVGDGGRRVSGRNGSLLGRVSRFRRNSCAPARAGSIGRRLAPACGAAGMPEVQQHDDVQDRRFRKNQLRLTTRRLRDIAPAPALQTVPCCPRRSRAELRVRC